MARTYLPVLLLLGFVVANAMMMLVLSHLTMRHRPTPVKQTPYESGMPPLGDARERFVSDPVGRALSRVVVCGTACERSVSGGTDVAVWAR
jgi:NADH:ubiquinone oxidoreductase subunit 3 (subunit A)